MVKDCHNLAANIAESLWQLYCSSAARFTRGLFFAKGSACLNSHPTETLKQTNVWLNFCLKKECPKLLCGLGIWRQKETDYSNVE